MGGGGLGQQARGARGEVPIDPTGLHKGIRVKQGLEFLALGHIGGFVHLPHQLGKFIILAEDHRHIARPIGGARRHGPGAYGGSNKGDGGVGIRQDIGGRQGGPSAHGMAFKADPVRIDKGQGPQIAHARRATKAFLKGQIGAEAMAALIYGEHHIAAPGQFNGKSALGLSGVDIAVYGQNAGSRCGLCRSLRHIEIAGEQFVLADGDANIADFNAVRCLHPGGDKPAGEDQ